MSLHEQVARLSPEARQRLATLIAAAERQTTSAATTTLVGYYVSATGQDVSADALRQFLGASLPAHLVPTLFRRIDAVPRTVHGKVDTAALPAPTAPSATVASSSDGAPSDTETQLLAIWSAVLGIRRITRTDSFFELGGDSLLAIRLLGQIRQQWNIDLSMADLFGAPTVAGAAAHIDSILWARTSSGARDTVADGETEEVVF